ncbi:MAG: ABC transporter ATP-binding protein, partial [Acutalibacteraceae bacterium]|nr:ABC transporter ATP-binding protein [Acutalibacteraceae bacterium]
MSRIELTHVTKRWGGFYAVDDLDLVIEDNAFVTLLGPSGCGKTTTLRMIAGLETPTAGRITIDDVVVFDSEAGINVPANKRRVGFLFQNYALWPNMTVYQNIAFGLSNIKEPGLSVTDDGEIIRNPDAGGAARKLTKDEIK